MEEKKDYYYWQRGNGNENVNKALFAAGIVLLLVCLKRALLLFLVEVQWRAYWVFIALNIVLLAILFTSTTMNPNSSQISDQEMTKKIDEEMMKKRGNCNEVEACKEDHHHHQEVIKSKKISKREAVEILEEELVVDEEDIEPSKLSMEELNERVEAFIFMFRQHLALDARKGRNMFYAERKQADMKKQQQQHMNFSSDGVNCFVLKVQG